MNADLRHIDEVLISKIGHKIPFIKGIKKSRIGVFDSGVGGLTVLKKIISFLPTEDILYLADTARVPYGGRTKEEIISINREILNYFEGKKIDLVVMACGTSSSIAYPALKDDYTFPIVSLIRPGAKAALNATRNLQIGIIATIGTVNSQSYQKMISELNFEAKAFAEGCPLFVPLIEGGFFDTEETRKIAREYLSPLLSAGVDTIILGCTHFPHLSKIIQEIAGEKIVLVDPSENAALEVREIMESKKLINPKNHKGHIDYVVTGSVSHFEELGSRLLGVKQVTVS